MSGTEGAWDFVSDDAQLLPFLKRIQRPTEASPTSNYCSATRT
jgi:hypothetical protein